jgi:FkbM family methyltransferase
MSSDSDVANVTYRGRNFAMSTYGTRDVISNVLLQGLLWEPRVANYIHAFCSKPGSYFVDVGANIGAHTCIAAIAGAARIYAIECNPDTFRHLSKTKEINHFDNLTTLNIAVSDAAGELPFSVVPDNAGASHITTTHLGWIGPATSAGTVKTSTFDSLDLHFDEAENILLKMDVEAHELPALRGMDKLLDNWKTRQVILELSPVIASVGVSVEIIDLLAKKGFGKMKLLFEHPVNRWYGTDDGKYYYPDTDRTLVENRLNRGSILEIAFIKE